MKNLVRVLFLLLWVTPAYAVQGSAGVTTNNGSAVINLNSTGGLANNTGTGSKQLSLIRTCSDNELLKYTTAGGWACAADSTGGTPAFNAITSGTNTTAAMVVDSGASIDWSGTGKITANLVEFNPSSQTVTSNTYQVTTSGVSHVCLDSTASRDMTANPPILDGSSGQLLVVQNCDSGSEFIRFNDGNGLQLAGDQSVNLAPGEAIALVYVNAAGASDWFEVARTSNDSNVILAKNYLACDGVTDDRAALKTLIEAGGAAAGKQLDMSGCIALIGNAGGDNSVAFYVAPRTHISCDGSPQSGFKLAGKVCVGGDSPGAGCSTTSDCSGTATSCSVEGGGTNAFAFTDNDTYIVFSQAYETAISDTFIGESGMKLTGCSLYTNQLPEWGKCASGADTGEACRSVCNSTTASLNYGYTCDDNADCNGVVGACQNDGNNCTTNCTSEGVWPAGKGDVRWVWWPNTIESEISGNTIYNLGSTDSTGVFTLGTPYYNSTTLFKDNKMVPYTKNPFAGSNNGNNFIAATVQDLPKIFNGGFGVTLLNNSLSSPTSEAIVASLGNGSIAENNVLSQTGGGNTGAALVTGSTNVAHGNLLSAAGGSAGISVGDYNSIVSNTISPLGTGNWVVGIRFRGSNNVATGNIQTGGAFCARSAMTAGTQPSGNNQYISNRCYAPVVSCAALTTGAHFGNNYCAWLPTNLAAVWIGDPGNIITEQCTALDTPYDCCNNADQGNCDGTAQGSTPTTNMLSYGSILGHGNIVGNLIHTVENNTSLIKVAGVGKRCTGTNASNCTGASAASARGGSCACVNNNDCVSGSCTLPGAQSIVSVVGNSLMLSGSTDVGFDLLLDDDDFGTSTTEAGAVNTDQTVSGMTVSSNVFSGTGRAVNISSNATAQGNITKMAFLANAFNDGPTRFTNWKWSMGVKDDNPVAILMGSTLTTMASTGTAFISPIGIVNNTTEGSAEQYVSVAGTAFRGKCGVISTMSSTFSRSFALRRAGSDSAMTCSVSSAASTCSSQAEVTFGVGARMSWKQAATGSPVATEAACSLLYEITDTNMGWQW